MFLESKMGFYCIKCTQLFNKLSESTSYKYNSRLRILWPNFYQFKFTSARAQTLEEWSEETFELGNPSSKKQEN